MEFHRSTSASRQSWLSSHLNATDVSRGAITTDGRLLTHSGLYRAATIYPPLPTATFSHIFIPPRSPTDPPPPTRPKSFNTYLLCSSTVCLQHNLLSQFVLNIQICIKYPGTYNTLYSAHRATDLQYWGQERLQKRKRERQRERARPRATHRELLLKLLLLTHYPLANTNDRITGFTLYPYILRTTLTILFFFLFFLFFLTKRALDAISSFRKRKIVIVWKTIIEVD